MKKVYSLGPGLTRGTVLFSGNFLLCLVLVQSRKTGKHPNERKNVDRGVKHQHRQNPILNAYCVGTHWNCLIFLEIILSF